jgi:hypothetical protein
LLELIRGYDYGEFDRVKNDHVKEDEMGRACSMNEGKHECI